MHVDGFLTIPIIKMFYNYFRLEKQERETRKTNNIFISYFWEIFIIDVPFMDGQQKRDYMYVYKITESLFYY